MVTREENGLYSVSMYHVSRINGFCTDIGEIQGRVEILIVQDDRGREGDPDGYCTCQLGFVSLPEDLP